MELSNFTLAELKNLLQALPEEIKRREKDGKAQARKDLDAFAAERGFSLEELLGNAKAKKERPPVAAKYRHPQNADLQWTGRGRQPKWIVEFIAAGGTLDQLSI
ncbi:MAG: H-NS histone family protein [Nitrosomonas ureae]